MGYVHVHVDNIMCSTRQEPYQEYSLHDNDHNNTWESYLFLFQLQLIGSTTDTDN